MNDNKRKMTAPIASVGADVEQPQNFKTNQSIADLPRVRAITSPK